MSISQDGLEMIMDFEGLRLEAYLDAVRVPTIGYGTTRYPDGRRVSLGDAISEEQAEAFLKFECDRLGRDILKECVASLNQNQLDALTSFCYNLGLGAFLGSTLLREIKASNFAAASAEFPRWNKGTVSGIRTELRGLTRRRARERQLFDSGTTAVPDSGEIDISPVEKVIAVKLCKDKGVNFVTTFDSGGNIVEILELGNLLPDTLLSALRLYPNLRSVDFADDGRGVPPGALVTFSGRARPIARVPNPPKLNRRLLVIGVIDDDGDGDVTNLQARLKELGYDPGEVDGIFGRQTDAAVKEFQADCFGENEADGRVGPRTWDKLWGAGSTVTIPTTPGTGTDSPISRGKNYLRLKRTDSKDQFGLVKLSLAYFKDGQFVDSIEVCSGQARRQVFREARDSQTGSMQPLPEGRWALHDIEWAAGKDVYDRGVWSKALGPAKIRLDFVEPLPMERAAIEIHMDWNRDAGAPGTAGCVGLQNVADFKKLVSWLRDTDPKFLFVDWELGTCPTP